jgi:hypothetical protein
VITVRVENAAQIKEGDYTEFIFRASSPTPYELPLNVTIGGTATQGVDYIFTYGITNGKVVFGANQTVTEIVVQAQGDLAKEKKEKVTVTINPGPGYKTTKRKSASITIVNVPPPP